MNVKLIWMLCLSFSIVSSYKILFLAPFNAKSHWLFLENFVKALLQRQHEVTCITSISLTGTQPTNYTEVLIEPPLAFESIMSQEQLFKISGESPISILFKLPGIRKYSAEYAFESVRVQQFLQRNDLHFDLVINEEFFQESFSMFAYKYKTPLITISTYGNSDFFDHQMGLITPWSHVPNLLLNYDDNMNFFERYHNVFVSIVDWLTRQYMHLPYQAEVAKKYFGDLAPLPSIDYLLKNVSLILVNTHRSVLPPRPAMPGIINVGGAHIKPPNPLPNDLKEFLDEAADGVIYFSLGTILKSSEMPQDKLNIFLNSFKIMKQRILWKYESETLVDIPPNVMIRKWLPQDQQYHNVPGTDGNYPNCKPRTTHQIRCPPGWLGDYYPNCTYKACAYGQVGIYPDCRTPPDVPYCYKQRQLGTYPDCYDPCPPNQMGRPDKEPGCRPIPCPTGKGWTGDIQPNCKYTPMCPENAPGVWPDCQELYCTANFQGNYPDCVCPAPFILRSKDVCTVPSGYNPLNE